MATTRTAAFRATLNARRRPAGGTQFINGRQIGQAPALPTVYPAETPALFKSPRTRWTSFDYPAWLKVNSLTSSPAAAKAFQMVLRAQRGPAAGTTTIETTGTLVVDAVVVEAAPARRAESTQVSTVSPTPVQAPAAGQDPTTPVAQLLDTARKATDTALEALDAAGAALALARAGGKDVSLLELQLHAARRAGTEAAGFERGVRAALDLIRRSA